MRCSYLDLIPIVSPIPAVIRSARDGMSETGPHRSRGAVGSGLVAEFVEFCLDEVRGTQTNESHIYGPLCEVE